MKRHLPFGLFLIFITVFFTSCIKDTYTRYEDNIVGTWTFEKVTKNSTIATGRNDLTHEWDMYELTFYSNGDAELFDNRRQTSSHGSWTLSEVVGSNSEGETLEYVINLSIIDRAQIKQYSWQVTSVTQRKLRLMEYYNRDYYYYVLERQ